MEVHSLQPLQLDGLQLLPVMNNNVIRIDVIGTAENQHSEALENFLENLSRYANTLVQSFAIFDFTQFTACYSQCISVLMNWLRSDRRPRTEFVLGSFSWQLTSLKVMVRMAPNCTIVESTTSNPVCRHTETHNDEDYFFAPTGKGSIVTKVFCNSCGAVLTTWSEYFD